MRTRLALLSAAFVALVTLNSPAFAFSPDAELAPVTAAEQVGVTGSILALSEVVHANIAVLQTEAERIDDEARLGRIMARRGRRLEPGWYARQIKVSDAPASIVAWPPINEDLLDYGHYAGPVDPVILTTILSFNTTITREKATDLAGLIQVTADRYGVDPLLVTALVSQESAFHQGAISPVGATGLGQLMPETAADLGVDAHNAQGNLDGCVRYLADLLYTWSGSQDPTALALASYNAGAGNVEKYNGVPPFEETRNYVAVIKDRYATLSAGQAL